MVAAKLKPNNTLPIDLTDSKLLSSIQKELFYQQLLIVCEFGEGWVTVDELNEMGLGAGLKLGAMRAIASLPDVENEDICIDGKVNFLKDSFDKSFTKVGADLTEPIVSAASVYAKVLRDKYMQKLHYEMPQYGFNSNVGYGTQKHVDALKKYGVTKYHRKTFKPIMALL